MKQNVSLFDQLHTL